jgi:hypothetical protein
MSPPIRRSDPRPPAAWWSESDKEWVEGTRDTEGHLHGRVRYWDAEGHFISECEHAQGLPHGRAQRFYADGSLAQECTYSSAGSRASARVTGPGAPTWSPCARLPMPLPPSRSMSVSTNRATSWSPASATLRGPRPTRTAPPSRPDRLESRPTPVRWLAASGGPCADGERMGMRPSSCACGTRTVSSARKVARTVIAAPSIPRAR